MDLNDAAPFLAPSTISSPAEMGGANPNFLGVTAAEPVLAGGPTGQNFANTNQMIGLPIEQIAAGTGMTQQQALNQVNQIVQGGENAILQGVQQGVQATQALNQSVPVERQILAPQQGPQQQQQFQPVQAQPQQNLAPVDHQPIHRPDPDGADVIPFPNAPPQQQLQPAGPSDLAELQNILKPQEFNQFQQDLQPQAPQVLLSNDPNVPPVVPQPVAAAPAVSAPPSPVEQLASIMARREQLDVARLEREQQSTTPAAAIDDHIQQSMNNPQYRAFAMQQEGLNPQDATHSQLFDARIQNMQLEQAGRARDARMDGIESQFTGLQQRARDISARRQMQGQIRATPVPQQARGDALIFVQALMQQGVPQPQALQRASQLFSGAPQPQQQVQAQPVQNPMAQRQLQALTVSGQGSGQLNPAPQQPQSIESIEQGFLGNTQFAWGNQ